MDYAVSGFVLDPAKCHKLSMGEKRKLIHEIAHWAEDPPMVLSSLTRGELLEIICAEMGKERKYTGYTKIRMIEHLLKLVSGESKKQKFSSSLNFSPTEIQTGLKRPRKQEQPIQQATDFDHAFMENISGGAKFLLCLNLACRAILAPEDVFCKRCSCCICHRYDANKDPSLWLTCESDSPNECAPCGMSCHLKCALEHERSGILKADSCMKLDGSFYCVYCGKINGLMRTWKRQLLVAKEARRVDILCLRLSLSHRMLEGTEQYTELKKVVETAVKKLENEVGPLDQACSKMDRGIVNRLSCSIEVHKLCNLAVEAFDSMFSNLCSDYMDEKEAPPPCRIHFEELSPTTVTIVLECEDRLLEECLGCRLWHRKSTNKDYPKEATYTAPMPEKRFKLVDLSPSTEFFCKVSLFSNTRTLGICEAKWVTPASREKSISIFNEQREDEKLALIVKANPFMDSVNYGDNNSIKNVSLGSPTSDPPLTPCKFDHRAEVSRLSGTKRLEETDYEYCVKVIRWLEQEGHMERDFRVKFLTWFSLKAGMREKRVVSVFVDALIDDPPSLAGQMIDTFTDEIYSERKTVHWPGFGLCSRLWH